MNKIDLTQEMSFNAQDIANIDIDKYQKGIFSPSPPKSNTLPPPTHHAPPTNATHPPPSPKKSHPVPPNYNNNRRAAMELQRKVHLGPHFDRLGILNQEQMQHQVNTPHFAKALQQHGSTTLGAILQAHQHALQQHIQRENFLQMQQQQQHFYMNNVYQQHHRNMMMRADDQIVPNNPQLQQHHHQQQPQQQQHDAWIRTPYPHQHLQRQQHDSDDSDTSATSSHVGRKRKFESYVIFNGENREEEDENAPAKIEPPNKSVFVRYKSESNDRLPSFDDTFSEKVEKFKEKENKQENPFDIYTPSGNDAKEEQTETKTEPYTYSDFLNEVGNTTTKDTSVASTTDVASVDEKGKTKTETSSQEETTETAKATESINIFNEELDLADHSTYLFNGNSDEHYFQTFKDNNLQLLHDLNNKHPEGEDITKLLHSPMDFLNEKF